MPPKAIIGHRVDVKDRNSHYAGHWGFVVGEESPGEFFVSGGSIGRDVVPILSKSQLKVRDDEVITPGLPQPEAVAEYINDTDVDWGIDPDTAIFKLKPVALVALETAQIRPLRLDEIDMDMVGQTRTKGPIVLDQDYSVIDGMYRLADAVAAGARKVQAYVRTP
jgi:hypothetical protein